MDRINPKLEVVKSASIVPDTFSLGDAVDMLEGCAGDLEVFLEKHQITDLQLFRIEVGLSKAETLELKTRWQSALTLSAKIRMDRLRSKAFKMLEEYSKESGKTSAGIISFGKTVLAGTLMEDIAVVKSKFRPVVNAGPTSNDDPDASGFDEIEREFDQGEEG